MSLRSVHVQTGKGRLLRRHVQRRADHLGEVGEQRLVGQLLAGRLGDAEVDDLRHRRAVVQRDQHVRRLDVAVDDALLVGVLHCLTDVDEQLQTFVERHSALVAEVGDGDALHQLHHEVGPARVGFAAVEDMRDVGMVHQRQRLPLGLEAGNHLARVHAGLEHLEGDLAAHRLRLLGHEDDAEAALADLLQQLVGADDRAGTFGTTVVACGLLLLGPAQESARALMSPQQLLDTRTQGRVRPAGLFEKAQLLVGALAVQGFEKDRLGIGLRVAHGWSPMMFRYSMPRFRRNPPENSGTVNRRLGRRPDADGHKATRAA